VFELRHLRYFVAVAEELNFTRAAERLHTAQPSLSQQIRTLEAYLGIQLLARNRRKVELTPAGLRFLDEARLALAQTEKAVIRAREGDQIERLRLGFTHGLIVALLPQLRPLLRTTFPQMQITTQSMPAPDLEQALKDDEVDLIFSNTPSKEYDVTSHRLFGQSLIAAFPHSHPEAAVPGGISLAALATEKIIVDATSMSAGLLHRLAGDREEQGIPLDTLCEAGNFFEALGHVLSGDGIGLFESSFLRLMPSGVVPRKLDGPGLQLDVIVLHRSGLATAKLGKLLQIFQKINVLQS